MGGGIAALTGLARWHRQEKQRQESAEDTSADDDILYVRLPKLTKEGAPHQKIASVVDDATGAALAFAGLPLSAILTYTAVDRLMRSAERKRVQKELDESQQIFLGRLKAEAEANKLASDKKSPVSTGQTILGAVGAAPILAAIASGVLTNKLLSHYMPEVPNKKKRKDITPRRVVVLDDDTEKQSSFQDGVDADEMELVLKVAASLEQVAPVGISDVIKVAANGMIGDLYAAACVSDIFDVAEKLAADLPDVDKTRKYAAVTLLARDTVLRPQLALTSVGVILDRSPEFCLLAKSASANDLEDGFVSFAKLASMASRAEVDITKLVKVDAYKSASAAGIDMSNMLQQALETAMSGDNDADEGEHVDNNAGEESDPEDFTSEGIPEKYLPALDDIMASWQRPASL